MSDKCTVCICGGGNGAHTLAGMSAAHGQTARVLTMFQDEAERWTKRLQEEPMKIVKKLPDGSSVEESMGFNVPFNNYGDIQKYLRFKGKPSLVTNDPAKAIPGCNMIVMVLPAFAHETYFKAIAPHLQPNTAIVGIPGQPGFEFQFIEVVGKDKARKCNIMSFDSLPWATRITEFGHSTEILGCKYELMGSQLKADSELKFDPLKAMQCMVGELPKLTLANNYLEPYLMTKCIVHPPLMYIKWKGWDGKPLAEQPLFYQGLDQLGADCLSKISSELVATANAISEQKPKLKMTHVWHLKDRYKEDYKDAIKDDSSLLTIMQSNVSYEGLTHPMKKTDDGKWLPNFESRFLQEDIPFGIVVTKGLAELAKVPTPTTDEVIVWAQEKMGKEYIKDGVFNGKDIKSSRAPQAYGYNSLDDLEALL